MTIWRITGRKGWKRLDYRNEWKYQVSGAQLAVLAARLSPILRPDGHHRPGGYAIRSLYFDDFSNSCLWENEAGVDDRRKYRLRIYNGDASLIKLEIKEKKSGFTKKTSCSLGLEELSRIQEGDYPQFDSDRPTLNQLLLQMKCSGMAPKAIISYERTAFVHPTGNVRITFDRNISASACCGAFLEDTITDSVPVLPAGMQILEVKYDELLPDMIHRQLDLGKLRQTAFSKYYLGRLALSGDFPISR